MQRNADIAKRLDVISLLCLGVVAIAWFGMDTLVVNFGRFTQSTPFYELGVIVLHPAALLVGVGTGHALELTAFTLLALTTLFVALAAPVLSTQRAAWLAGCAPLALMILCAALLYGNGSQQPPPVSSNPGLHDDLMRLTNHVMQHAQNTLVSHISVGAGGIVAALASLALALRAIALSRAQRRPGARLSSGDESRSSPLGSSESALRSMPHSAP
jgi:hypothetical protein